MGDFDFRADQDLLRDLLNRVRALETDNAESKSWTPLLLGSGAPAAAYTAGAIKGTVLRRRNWVFARFQMVLAGWSAPGGGFFVRTPWPPNNLVAANQVVGQWHAIKVGGGSMATGSILGTSSTVPGNTGDFWLTANGGTISTTSTSPWTWANGDVLSGVMQFEVAPGF